MRPEDHGAESPDRFKAGAQAEAQTQSGDDEEEGLVIRRVDDLPYVAVGAARRELIAEASHHSQ